MEIKDGRSDMRNELKIELQRLILLMIKYSGV